MRAGIAGGGGRAALFAVSWTLFWGSAYIDLVQLHGPDGQRVFINPPAITTLREPSLLGSEHFPVGTRCVIVTTSGKFLPVQETCDQVRAAVTR